MLQGLGTTEATFELSSTAHNGEPKETVWNYQRPQSSCLPEHSCMLGKSACKPENQS